MTPDSARTFGPRWSGNWLRGDDMRLALDTGYPPERFEQNRKRMEARVKFEYEDRLPLAFCVVPRFFAPIFGMTYGDLFKDVET